jgi:transposase-like protein
MGVFMKQIIRKRHGAKLKAEVAMEAMRGQKTTTEIASTYKVHPSQVNQWKKHLKDTVPNLFCSEQQKKKAKQVDEGALFEEIGRLKFELDWLKKKLV